MRWQNADTPCMAIYADLLSMALLDGDQESDIAVLIQIALMARLAITSERANVTVPGALAVQVSYAFIPRCRVREGLKGGVSERRAGVRLCGRTELLSEAETSTHQTTY